MLREERLTREKRLQAMNLCRNCGVSLAGVADNKCPECGQLIQRGAKGLVVGELGAGSPSAQSTPIVSDQREESNKDTRSSAQ